LRLRDDCACHKPRGRIRKRCSAGQRCQHSQQGFGPARAADPQAKSSSDRRYWRQFSAGQSRTWRKSAPASGRRQNCRPGHFRHRHQTWRWFAGRQSSFCHQPIASARCRSATGRPGPRRGWVDRLHLERRLFQCGGGLKSKRASAGRRTDQRSGPATRRWTLRGSSGRRRSAPRCRSSGWCRSPGRRRAAAQRWTPGRSWSAGQCRTSGRQGRDRRGATRRSVRGRNRQSLWRQQRQFR
jgi:hypothetical protein